MKFEWDEAKNALNIEKHALDFADAKEMFQAPMLTTLDTRFDYDEDRFVGIGFLKSIVAVAILLSPTKILSASSHCERRQNVSALDLKEPSKTDWAKLDTMTDEEIDMSDTPELDDDFFKRATLRMPEPVSTTIEVDPGVLAWFEAQSDSAKLMNAALRIYAEAHQKAR